MTLRLSLISGIKLVKRETRTSPGSREIWLEWFGQTWKLDDSSDAALQFLRLIASSEVTEAESKAMGMFGLLTSLNEASLLIRRIWDGRLVRAESIPVDFCQGTEPDSSRVTRYRIADDVVVCPWQSGFLLERVSGGRRIHIGDASLASEVLRGVHGVPAGILGEVVTELISSGIYVDAQLSRSRDHHNWAVHERWFHLRSRRHRAAIIGDNFGAVISEARASTYLEGTGRHHPLPRSRREAEDQISLGEALDRRLSRRAYNETNPVSSQALSNLLSGVVGREPFNRSYPSGGAIYELDLVLAVRNAEGVPAGLYIYRKESHTLEVLNGAEPAARMCDDARVAMAGSAAPQVLVIMVARFNDLFRKYREIGYSLILKHVGIVMESWSLLSVAEDTSCCLLGTGTPRLLQDYTGWDPDVAASVGEIAVGSRS